MTSPTHPNGIKPSTFGIVTTEAPPEKKKRGRPPNPARPHPINVLPPPPFANLTRAPDKFFQYWHGIDKALHQHCDVKVYRNWPHINRQNTGQTKSSIDIVSGISPFGFPDWMSVVLNRYGSGDYTFYFNETPGGRQVTMTFVSTKRDFINYPPILDKRELMIGDPKNAPYLDYMRQRGHTFPGDIGYEGTEEEKEEKEMEVKAASAIAAAPLETMARALESMTDRVVRGNEPDTRRPPEVERAAAAASIKMTQEAAQSAIDMNAKAADRLASSRTDSADPIKQFEAVAGLIERISGNGSKDGGMMAMILKDALDSRNEANRRANEMQRDFIAMLDKKANGDGENNKPKSMLDQLKELKELKMLLKDEEDDGENNGNGGKKSKGPDITEMMLAAAPVLGQAINGLLYYGANMMHNYAAAKTGAQAPQPPTNPAVLAQEQQQQIQQQQPQQTQTQSIPNGMSGTNGQPQQQINLTPEQQQFAPYHPFLAQIQGALIHHLQRDDLGGFAFADWLINSNGDGRLAYEQIKGVGPEVMMQLLKSYPPLWGRIGGAEQRVNTFVLAFLDYDNERERLDKEAEEDEGEE